MNKVLIRKMNKTIIKIDEFYILGDITMKGTNYVNTILGCFQLLD